MNPEIKTKWVAALKSGEYVKGTSFLKTIDEKFCCLGVLCDLYAKEHGIDAWEKNGEISYQFRVKNSEGEGDSEEIKTLPFPVQIWSGVSKLGSYPNEEPYGCLTRDNDSGKSFTEIAETIQTNF